MKNIVIVMIVMFTLGSAFPGAVRAESPWAEEETYGAKVGHKFMHGLTNVLFGWTEIWRTPVRASDEGEDVATAFGMGFVIFAGNTVGGALNAVTAPVTSLEIPLPNGGFEFDN